MRNIIPIISGKGGVGKSTVAVNLAVAIAATGAKVALIDCDFYGPSIPTLMGGGQVIPDHEGRLIPPEKFGVKYVSLGFFLSHPDDPVIWRGPMFNKALVQLFNDVNWGEVDYCIVDMPPGTGDAQLSFSQAVKALGAVVVTTPQEVALADVRKSINMLSKVGIPVLGIVENMSGLRMPDGTINHIFGEGGGLKTAQMFSVPLLTQIPLDNSIRQGGDTGLPIVIQDNNELSGVFKSLALKVTQIADKTASAAQQVNIVN
jgi:ATP-binding protein involved in chromosome partitioning